jgi:hypothetical protein
MASSGFKASSASYTGSLSKKQFYVRLKRLRDAGLIEKRDLYYKTTTFGSLIHNGNIKMLEKLLESYWSLKAIDVLKMRRDFPLHQKETVVNEILQNSGLNSIVNITHLSGFTVVKDYNQLKNEVIKILHNAQKEIFFATRYHDPHVSQKLFAKVEDGVTLHLLDGLPEQVSVESRLNAVLRTPPNKETFELINNLVRSPRFDLKKGTVQASFMVVDGTMTGYEITNYSNPEQFTIGIAHYDDPPLAQRFIAYYNMLAKDASIPRLLASVRRK